MLNFDKKENQNKFGALKPSQTNSNAIPVPKMVSFRTVTEKQEISGNYAVARVLKKKRKRRHTKPRKSNKPVWIHLDQPNSTKNNFGVRTEDPLIRKSIMYGVNAFWLTPSGTQPMEKVNKTCMVEGGENKDSYYVTQMNTFTESASLLLLTRGTIESNGVNVILLKPKETVFEGWTAKQIEAVWPKKKEREKLSPPEIKMIGDRLFRSNGGAGVPLLRALPLATFQTIVTELRAKKPMVGATKVTINLATIKPLILNLEAAFGFWSAQQGNSAHMYKAQRDAVVIELADYLRANDFARFTAALALISSDVAAIQPEASTMAAAKGALPPSSSSSSSSTTTATTSQLMYELKADRMIGMLNAVAAPLVGLEVNTPQKTLCKSMVKSSVFMKWVGPQCVPSWEDLFAACESDTGFSNDNMRNILHQQSQVTWYGMLCCIHLCYQSGIDCSAIAGEGHATKNGNKIGVYDRDGHLGKVKRHTQQPTKLKIARTFQITFKSICKHGKRADIVQAWDRIFAEMKAFAKKDFWTGTKLDETFKALQINIEVESSLKSEKKKWMRYDQRNVTLSNLKWVFVLYMEYLPSGTEPTLQNFLTTLMSPLGSCFCNAYIAWLGTAVYSLRMRVKENPANKPSWLGKFKKKTVIPDIKNTLHGAPATLLFRALETMVNIEWPRTQSILKSAQDNMLGRYHRTHGESRLGRAAGARMYWLMGSLRVNERFAPRCGIIDQIRVMSQTFWDKIQPGDNHQKELRTGLSMITEQFGSVKLVVAQSKVTGADVDANTAKFNSKKHEIELYTPGGGFHRDYSSLATTMHRFLDAADILCGDASKRQYTIKVKETNGMWMVMQATHVPSPANNHHSFSFAVVPQEMGNRRPYEELFSKFETEYLAIRNQEKTHKKGPRKKFTANEKHPQHLAAIASLGVQMCFMPPAPTVYDHTTSTAASTKSNSRIRDFFHDIASDMNRNVPISLCNPMPSDAKQGKWNLQHIPSPTTGYVSGNVTAKSVYTFKSDNTLTNLINHGFSQDEIASLRQLFRAIEVNELIVHPKWYGRQTQVAMKVGLLFSARQIQGWNVGDSSTDAILSEAALAQARVEGHIGNGDIFKKGSIILTNYCKSFKLALGNPAKYFEHFDRRVRAHPTPAVFSLEDGIESFPSLIVECIEHDASESPLERALKDVRLLTVQEQMANLTTLTVYKLLLQFVIDIQDDLPTHQQCVIRWFNERATYDADKMEKEIRQSARKKQKTKK